LNRINQIDYFIIVVIILEIYRAVLDNLEEIMVMRDS